MKKIKKWLSLALTLTTLLSFFGCDVEKQSSENAGETIIFRDFEDWGPDFQTLQLMLNFGKVSRNEEAEYVRSGKYSCKIQPLGTRETNNKPMMYWPTISTTFDYDVSDFKNLDYIYVPGIRKAIEDKTEIIKAYTIADGKTTEFELKVGELTNEEREIILKGCLINYNRI